MSRRAFERWGWELSDREFGQALATLGVMADELGEASTLDRLRTDLQARATAADRRPLVWDLAPLRSATRRRAVLKRLPPEELAAAWRALLVSQVPGRDLQREPPLLELRPPEWLADDWLFEMLLAATPEATPYFPLAEPLGRLRWHWPLRVGFAAGQAWLRSTLVDELSESMRELLEAEVGPARCDLLCLWLVEGEAWPADTSLPEATFVALLYAPGETSPGAALPELIRRASAWGGAMVRIALDPSAGREWLRAFLRGLSHESALLSSLRAAGGVELVRAAPRLLEAPPLRLAGELLAAALEQTAATAGAEPPAPRLPGRTRVVLGMAPRARPRMAELGRRLRETDLAFARESDGATDVAIVERAAEPVLRELQRHPVEERYIRAAVELRDGGEPSRLTTGFAAGARHHLSISIGPPEKGLLMSDIELDPGELADAAGHRLTVVLSEPDLLPKPLVRKIVLPRFGASRAAEFEMRVKRGAKQVRARVSVLHRGRILQTALLSGPVLPARQAARLAGQGPDEEAGIRLRAEANLRPNFAALDDRSRFHAALVLNHDGDGQQGGTAIARDHAVSFKLDWVREAVTAIGRVLDRAERDKSFGRKLDSKTSVHYLRQLALQGIPLYEAVGKRLEQVFGRDDVERLQVLSANPNTLLPVELIYDLPPPAASAQLCPNWEQALDTGRCRPDEFHEEDEEGALNVVCPAGFWGVSKVIEREALDPADVTADVQVKLLPERGRSTLRPLAPVLLAASDRVNDVAPTELDRLRSALGELTGDRLTLVRTWLDWARRLKADDPPALVLLSHTELNGPDGVSLEIARAGGSELRALAAITDKHVNPNGKEPGPVVLLLGCTTAVPLESFQSGVVKFKDKGASLVVGTIAPVLGRHASRTAEALLEEFKRLTDAYDAPESGVPVGEALRQVRRRMLGRGILMAMSLAVYGDADWRLAGDA